jgi:hypothetical protein
VAAWLRGPVDLGGHRDRGARWRSLASYLVSKDFEPEVGEQRSQLYGVLFFVSLPAFVVVHLFDRRRDRR